MKKCLIVVSTLTTVLLMGSLRLGTASAPHDLPLPRAQQSQSMPEMKMHEQMMAEMAAANAKLEALVRDMNAASGDAKVTAMAAVVAELVRQHASMHQRMGQMHQEMMGGRGRMMNR